MLSVLLVLDNILDCYKESSRCYLLSSATAPQAGAVNSKGRGAAIGASALSENLDIPNEVHDKAY